LGSTVTVLEMDPVVGGATSTIVMVDVDSGKMVPPVQVSTFAASTEHPPAKSGATKLSKTSPSGSGSRTRTPVAVLMPLLPTMNV